LGKSGCAGQSKPTFPTIAAMAALTTILYHSIARSESDFERGLGVVTTPERFESHLNYFEKHYDFVDLDTVLAGRLPRRALLITFDDFYQSVLTVAREVLKPRGIPSLFFVNPDLLGADTIALDNLLAFSVARFGLAAVCEAGGLRPGSIRSVYDFIAHVVSELPPGQRRALRSVLLQSFAPTAGDLSARCPIMKTGELAECKRLGIEIGNHTATHVHGRSLRPQELHREIVAARERLESLTGTAVRAFSLPYGSERDLTEPLLAAIRSSGHEAIFLVHARSNAFRKAPDIWYRVCLHNEPVSELPFRLAVAPVLRSLKHMLLQ
jgi:peptidoglycan/xylan/chitin deacetylase (PgdA/CDA1 family)